ncbi:hypothetical protein HK101_002733, partial [Irineochytrium annulatum]
MSNYFVQGPGSWSTLVGESGALCIHTALLPNGKILCVDRPHELPFNWWHAQSDTANYTGSEVTIDEANLKISMVTKPLAYNAFCAGHSQAADGSIWMIGGDPRTFTNPDGTTLMADGLKVKRNYKLSDTTAAGTGTWLESNQLDPTFGDMLTERWYPTVATLYDESIIIMGGWKLNIDLTGSLANHTDALVKSNPTIEYHNIPADDNTRKLGLELDMDMIRSNVPYVLYPIVFQLPSSAVFVLMNNWAALLDIHSSNAATRQLQRLEDDGHAPWNYPFSSNAFLLPMRESDNYTATVMICGGSLSKTVQGLAAPASGTDIEISSDECFAMRDPGPSASWKKTAPMPNARVMLDSVLLPDGTVMITNGAYQGRAGGYGGQCVFANSPVFKTDLYDPVKDAWTTVGQSSQIRLYHSGAVLLASGRVVTTGSEMDNLQDCWQAPTFTTPTLNVLQDATACYPGSSNTSEPNPVGVNCGHSPYNYKFEMFSPAYLSTSTPQPKILTPEFTTSLAYGSTISVQVDSPVTRVTLVRYSTTTHNTNTDQRHLEPTVLCFNGTTVWFKLPPNGSVAPPGNYHLFVLTASGVPSAAMRVNIRAAPVGTV